MKKKILLSLLFLACFASLSFAQVGIEIGRLNGDVSAIAEDAQFIYAAGDFTRVNGVRTDNIGIDASSQALLNFPEVQGNVTVCIGDGNNGWYMGGTFTSVGGVPRANLAHILPDKTLDLAWNPSPDGSVSQLYLVGDGLFAIGSFKQIGTTLSVQFAKISAATGQADPAWNIMATPLNPSQNYGIQATFTANDVFITGLFETVKGVARKNIAKLALANGALDTLWNPDFSDTAEAYKTLVVGNDLLVSIRLSSSGYKIAKISSLGVMDASWGVSTNLPIENILLAGTEIFITGKFTQVAGQACVGVAKIKQDGSLDTSWGANIQNYTFYSLEAKMGAAFYNNALYIFGDFKSASNTPQPGFAKLDVTTGAIAAGWSAPVGIDNVSKHIFVGSDIYFTSKKQNGYILTKMSGNGVVDNGWSVPTAGKAQCLYHQNGALYMGGAIKMVGGEQRAYLVRFYKSNNALDAAWTPQVDNVIHAMKVANGNVYIGGKFQTVNGTTRKYLAKISATTGALDTQWTSSIEPNLPNQTLPPIATMDADATHLYIGGAFYAYYPNSNTFLNNFGRINLNTGAAEALTNDIYGSVDRLVSLGDCVYAVGDFSMPSIFPYGIVKIHKSNGVDYDWSNNTYIDYTGWLSAANDKLYARSMFGYLYSYNQATNEEAEFSVSLTGSRFAASNALLFRVAEYLGVDRTVVGMQATDPAWRYKPLYPCRDVEVMGNDVYVFGGMLVKLANEASLPILAVNAQEIAYFRTITTEPSESRRFQVGSANVANNIVVSVAPTAWEISKDNQTWSNSITLAPTGASFGQEMFVRLKTGLSVGSQTGTIQIASQGLPSKTISLMGRVSQPVFSASNTPLNNFTTYPQTNSPSQSISISGTDLVEGVRATLTTSDWEISHDGQNWSNTINIPYSVFNGSDVYFITNYQLYVRLKSWLTAGDKNAILQLTSKGAETKQVTLTGKVIGVPAISVNVSTLSGFLTVPATASASQQLTVLGGNLSNNVEVSLSTNDWEISLDGQTWNASLTISLANGSINSTVYVRLKAGLSIGDKTAMMQITSQGADSKQVSLTGKIAVPTLSASSSILIGFFTTPATASASQPLTVSGGDLSNNVNISFTTNDWEISLDGQTWNASLTISPANGSVNSVMYARLKAGLSLGIKQAVLKIITTGNYIDIPITGEVQVASAISPAVLASVSVFPNPAKETLRVRVGEMGTNGTKITILDARGVAVHRIEQIDNPEIAIDIKQLPQGVYILLMEGHKGTLTKQFIKL